jgi:hypothetical protein
MELLQQFLCVEYLVIKVQYHTSGGSGSPTRLNLGVREGSSALHARLRLFFGLALITWRIVAWCRFRCKILVAVGTTWRTWLSTCYLTMGRAKLLVSLMDSLHDARTTLGRVVMYVVVFNYSSLVIIIINKLYYHYWEKLFLKWEEIIHLLSSTHHHQFISNFIFKKYLQ